MKRASLYFLAFFTAIFCSAQSYKQLKNVKPDVSWQVNLSEQDEDLQISSLKQYEESPKPYSNVDEIKNELRKKRKALLNLKAKTSYETTESEITPNITDTFNGKPIGGAGIPNDNSMAISNDGYIISVINTTCHILDKFGNNLMFRSLAGMTANQLGVLDRFYDPKVLYDPIADKFILVFLEGSESSDTRIVVGFTETNDPTQNWNFFALNGRPLGGTTWSDYPIIAHNKEDLFITVNLLRDNESWQEGFVQSFIWQINKESGYSDQDTLKTNLFYDIEYNNKSLWSICPVQPAYPESVSNMYFLTVRPDASANDTVFMHEVTNTVNSGVAEHKLTVLTSDTKYGVPPTALQKDVGISLQTNDTRVLSGTYIDNTIHYVQTTLVPENTSSGIYHGIINEVDCNAGVTGEIISSATLDYAYPSITFAGTEATDKYSMAITFSHSGMDVYPGTSAIYHNKSSVHERLYSSVIELKKGEGRINSFIADSNERWGDYTDIQRKYDEPGKVWLCGSYGNRFERNDVWIAAFNVNSELKAVETFHTFPNPTNCDVYISTSFSNAQKIDINLTDMQGKIVKSVKDQDVDIGVFEFKFSTQDLSSGAYVLSIVSEADELLHSSKIMVE